MPHGSNNGRTVNARKIVLQRGRIILVLMDTGSLTSSPQIKRKTGLRLKYRTGRERGVRLEFPPDHLERDALQHLSQDSK
jgi:hypothetical protein